MLSTRTRAVPIIVIAIAVIGAYWFGYLKKISGEELALSGVVAAVEGETIAIRAAEREADDLLTLRVNNKTKLIKRLYIMPRGLQDGEAFEPEMTEEPGRLSDIEIGTGIDAVVRSSGGTLTAVTIHYAAFSF